MDWLLRGLATLPLPFFRALGGLFGNLLWAFAPRRRHIVRCNLALCFPEATPAQRRHWERRTFVHFAQTFVDRVWLWHGDPALLARRVALSGSFQRLQNPEAVLCFVPHFYGMDAGWSRLTHSIDRRWSTFYAPQRKPWLDAWIRQGRQRHAQPVLVSRKEGLRPLLKALREGTALCLLPDMDFGKRDSVFVPFFGQATATVTSLPRLAKAASVPVVPWVCRLVPQGYCLEVMPAWPGYPSGDEVADAAFMNTQLEQYIRAMPDQYHWLHRRFKTRPDGVSGVY